MSYEIYDSPVAPREDGPRVNYREAENLLAARRPFQGNSMSAFIDGDDYVVLSYATVIAIDNPSYGPAFIAENRWGKTSGRHINLCRKCLSWTTISNITPPSWPTPTAAS